MAKMPGTLVRICLSTGMKPRSFTVDASCFAVEGLAVGHATHGHQHAIEYVGGDRARGIEGDADAFGNASTLVDFVPSRIFS